MLLEKKFTRVIYIGICLLLFCPLFATPIHASFHGFQTTREIAVPAELEIQVVTEFEQRKEFYSVSVRDDGWFLLRTRGGGAKNEGSLKPAYVDIYNEDGVFQKSIQYVSVDMDGTELTENSVNLYFDNYIVVYDLENETFSAYAIPRNAAQDAGIFAIIEKTKYTVDEWEYYCDFGVSSHRKLMRSNGTVEEVLIDLSGHGTQWWLYGVACFTAGIVILYVLHRNKRRHSAPSEGESSKYESGSKQ